jgi:hypothetical protein
MALPRWRFRAVHLILTSVAIFAFLVRTHPFSTATELCAPVELDWNGLHRWIWGFPKSLPFFRFCLPIFHLSLGNGSPLAAHCFQCGKFVFRVHGSCPNGLHSLTLSLCRPTYDYVTRPQAAHAHQLNHQADKVANSLKRIKA